MGSSTGQLYSPTIPAPPPPILLHASACLLLLLLLCLPAPLLSSFLPSLVPRLISMNIHYSMIFLGALPLPLLSLSFLSLTRPPPTTPRVTHSSSPAAAPLPLSSFPPRHPDILPIRWIVNLYNYDRQPGENLAKRPFAIYDARLFPRLWKSTRARVSTTWCSSSACPSI